MHITHILYNAPLSTSGRPTPAGCPAPFGARFRRIFRLLFTALVTASALLLGGCGTARNSSDPSAGGYGTARNSSDPSAGCCSTARNSSDLSADGSVTKAASSDSAASDTRSVFSILGPDAEAFAASWNESNVTEIIWTRNEEASETVTIPAGAAEIQELFQALSALQIGKPTNEMSSDAEDLITVSMNDGSSLTLTFNNGNLVSGRTIYQTSGKKAFNALRRTLFPEDF